MLKEKLSKNKYLNAYLSNQPLRVLVSTICSFLFALIFAVYSTIAGILYHSSWHFFISFYYYILIAIKTAILINEYKISGEEESIKTQKRKIMFIVQGVLMLLCTIALIGPISMMVMSKRQGNIGMIPAIAVAAYTTYKIVVVLVSYAKTRKSENLFIKSVKTLNLNEMLLSIMTLQNTLIMTFDSSVENDMLILSAITSFIITVLMLTISLTTLIKSIKNKSNKDNVIWLFIFFHYIDLSKLKIYN